jgi:hypothetical protein
MPSESTNPTPFPTQQPTASPEPQPKIPSPINYGYLIVAAVTLGVVALTLVGLRRKLIRN